MKIYEVGGILRDSLLGRDSKDLDLAISASSYQEMKKYVEENSKAIFLEKPEFGTIRYMSKDGVPQDISLCLKSRKSDGTGFELGTIEEDLLLRDFTVNSMARDIDSGKIIDPVGGLLDIESKTLRCTRDPSLVFSDDPLRIIRAIRFKIELSFEFDPMLRAFLLDSKNLSLLKKVNRERLRQELEKCLKSSTYESLVEFNKLGVEFFEYVFLGHGISLRPR